MSLRNGTMGLTEWLLLLLLSILWGGSFFFIEVAVEAVPPFTLVTVRVALATILLNIFLRLSNRSLPMDGKTWVEFILMGLMNNIIPFSLIVWGQSHISSGLASILNATTPLFTILIAHFWTDDEKITANKLIGVLIGFFGVVIIIGPGMLSNLGENTLAQVAVLAAALMYAAAGVFGRRFQKKTFPPIVVATGQVTASTIILAPLALMVDKPWTIPMPDSYVWGAIFGLAFLSTALAYILYFRILAAAGATNLLLVTFLIPISAILFGVTILGESLATNQIIGMALIGLGLIVIDGRLIPMLQRGNATC